ncbi:response regulator [Caulobacter segnis]|uniref:Response regulator receiver protein n=2 Tax=Caulobacter segnis TaxID=88688 RepID=D5VE04_CAUST|nr:response regulator [Caulobacter segnis]ADG08704.1 response regulator receiver protein [Caulobacter segnis ATCC 21756]AVQ00554.1 response regulator [Caulobacter segnis]
MKPSKVMIVEDEALVAMMVEDMLGDLGCEIAGSFGAVGDAMAWLVGGDASPDGAVLDVNIGGEMVFPVAEELRERGVPFVFATGYGDLPRAGFESIEVLAKPINVGDLRRAVDGFQSSQD